jgi:tetratricopeptide (TPR) repeat protein
MSARRDGVVLAGATLVAVLAVLAGCGRREPAGSAETFALLRSARELVAASRPDDARALYERVLAADPDCPPAHVEFGYFLFEDSPVVDYGRAIEQFEVALRLDPTDPLAACGLGIALQEVGDVDRAEPLLRSALASAPVQQAPGRTMVATAALGKIDAVRGRNDDALARFAEAARSPAATPRARAIYLTSRAELLETCGREPEARTELREAIALDPENVRAHHQLAWLLGRLGEAAEARKEARIAEILRQLVDHTARRFRVDVDRTIRLRAELVAAWPEYARGPYALVEELVACGRCDEARSEIEKLVKRDGSTAELQQLAARATSSKTSRR